MSASTSAGRPAIYSLNINGFRGVCVALVFLHHVANSGLPPATDEASWLQSTVRDLFMSFGYGVELFFMISGYVIVNSLRRHATVGAFLRDRALRIFPVWLPICLCLCIGSVVAHRHGFDVSPAESATWGWLGACLANLALLPPLVPVSLAHPASWSLTYEWVFYLLAALAAVVWTRGAVAPRVMSNMAKAAWLLACAVLVVCFPRSLFFLVGVWAALKPASLSALHDAHRRAPWLAWLSLPVFLLAWYGTGIFTAEYSVPLWQAFFGGHAFEVMLAFGAGLFLFANVAHGDSSSLAVLRTRAAQHLGTISYSFYLVHPLAMSAVKFALLKLAAAASWPFNATEAGSWSFTVIFAVASALVAWLGAWLSWKWLEQGLGRWLKRARSLPAARAHLRFQPTKT